MPAAPDRAAPVRPVRTPLEPLRLPADLTPAQIVPLSAGLAAVVAGYVAIFKGPHWSDSHAILGLAATIVALGAVFALERGVLTLTPKASLRFAGFGILAPFLYYFLHAGALVPLLVLQGLTTYRLGLGSVSPPAIAATFLTGLAFGPFAGLVACMGHVWPGIAVLGAVRGRRR